MTGRTRHTFSEIAQLATACLRANGCDEVNARAVAQTMTAAERDGSAGHGLFRMPGYVAALRSGKVDGKAQPTVERVAPGAVRVDAHGGFAPLALEAGREPLIEAAREQGVAMLGVVRCHHFAALWVEVEPLATAGLCAMACTAYMPAMPPAGGRTPLYGTNPLAFGWPRQDAPPMVFDMASAAMARGEIMVAARDGHAIPEGVGLDAEGNPTTDPQAIIDGGVVLPFGGYKGSNVAMMVELLAAGLIGERFSYEAAEHDNKDGGPPRGGEFILAIDPARLGGEGWRDHSEDFFARMLSIEGTRLPAARRYKNRAAAERDGVDVPDALRDKILELTKSV
jgi:delta1-piperideine-2-carboxylate reductase